MSEQKNIPHQFSTELQLRSVDSHLILFPDLMQSSTRQGVKVKDLVLDGISYLNRRRDFWQQQKPIYARVYERKILREEQKHDKRQKPADIRRSIEKNMEDIELSRFLAGS